MGIKVDFHQLYLSKDGLKMQVLWVNKLFWFGEAGNAMSHLLQKDNPFLTKKKYSENSWRQEAADSVTCDSYAEQLRSSFFFF